MLKEFILLFETLYIVPAFGFYQYRLGTTGALREVPESARQKQGRVLTGGP